MSFKKEYDTTVFFNTHYMDEADLYSDEIAIIDRGKMVKFGTADELKHSIKREIIQFNLKEGIVNDNILKIIKDLDFVNDVIVHDLELVVIVEDAETALPVVMEILRNEGIFINKISMSRPTLDDVFLKYAGIISSISGNNEVRQISSISRKG